MAIFSGASQFLTDITKPAPPAAESTTGETILRNAQETSDLEARRRERDLSVEKKAPHENIGHKGRVPYLNQPKPKFVAHKAPTKGKGSKDKKGSNRLGNELHFA
mmetsp:Transcript_2423/g.5078  ORF Transcript_2423/g.5078 Transcript_2423/m.5078 type:complete len:105 (+) Transcript_2423:322-636(+)|eukprot:CAMPEP_0178578984 /NCGR_PEP_ID=MMETSP0697-20121206/21835_1 /TAXON_ID=265572 /ORGANISM="Extubocellulus spinifer, Strain CCMP396" /LENGTH=104 /DNA_ID=CAMNT_0020214391 /DNA_START=133 /DNA_END=447 /DNA_ORIENTATION=-